jgi:predicted HAD superfamily Cof-like phosphohydrolase
MKKILFALAFAAVAVGSMSSAFADEYHHHHPVCHNVKVHHHWEKRCH